MTFRDPTVDTFIRSLIQSIEGKEAQIDKQRERTREIGERLNALGGFELMSWAHGQFSRIDRNSLEFFWHGIGRWKS